MATFVDHYEILQVSPQAEHEVITAAYKKLAFKYHPDRYAHSDAHQRLCAINEAYAILCDPTSRQKYDIYWREAHLKVRDESRASPPQSTDQNPPKSEVQPNRPEGDSIPAAARGIALGPTGRIIVGIAMLVYLVWLLGSFSQLKETNSLLTSSPSPAADNLISGDAPNTKSQQTLTTTPPLTPILQVDLRVLYLKTLICPRRVTEVHVENRADESIDHVRLEIDIVKNDGEVQKKVFVSDSIESHATWKITLEKAVRNVARIDTFCTATQGERKGTIHLRVPDEYSQTDLKDVEAALQKDDLARSLADALLQAAHPTGTFDSISSTPECISAIDKRSVTIEIPVTWKEVETKSRFHTTFAVKIDKKEGLLNIAILSEDSVIKYSQEGLAKLENQLKSICD